MGASVPKHLHRYSPALLSSGGSWWTSVSALATRKAHLKDFPLSHRANEPGKLREVCLMVLLSEPWEKEGKRSRRAQ